MEEITSVTHDKIAQQFWETSNGGRDAMEVSIALLTLLKAEGDTREGSLTIRNDDGEIVVRAMIEHLLFCPLALTIRVVYAKGFEHEAKWLPESLRSPKQEGGA